jgi:phosphomannomutase
MTLEEKDAKTLALGDPGRTDAIRFGTDGWRAIIGEDFNTASLARLADATARVLMEDLACGCGAGAGGGAAAGGAGAGAGAGVGGRVIIGYDCRQDAGRYAVLFGAVLASSGLEVAISQAYCPTPALCFSVSRDPSAIAGVMLTSSHNPAEYLGVKLRMSDGGASPVSFTDRIEAALTDALPASYADALALAAAAANGTAEAPYAPQSPMPGLCFIDLMAPYLEELASSVDAKAIAGAALRVVVDPMYGAGRCYLAQTLRRLGVEVVEVNDGCDPSFNGLHPEPIAPWIQTGAQRVSELGFDACLITDGDADRIGAVDSTGAFVSPHRILALVIEHLVEGRGQGGRVVRTLSGSNLVKRQCERLGLPLTTTPIGFKWIYEEMLAGDVLIGGEESGGIGIPAHVRERDGLLMSLLLTELMALRGQTLRELVDALLSRLGNFDYARRDLRLSNEQKEGFLEAHVRNAQGMDAYAPSFAALGETVCGIDHRDGLKLSFASDAWLLMRPSGTEPLVRVYAEATEPQVVESLLDIGCALVSGERL